MTYWYREGPADPHCLPLLFFHGIAPGLLMYINVRGDVLPPDSTGTTLTTYTSDFAVLCNLCQLLLCTALVVIGLQPHRVALRSPPYQHGNGLLQEEEE